MTTVTFTSSGSWATPVGVASTDSQCWGEGGNGATALVNSHSGGGGGGGESSEETTLAVSGTISFTIGSGGSGTATSFPGTSVTVTAHAGANGSSASHGAGGSGSTNTAHHSGGDGGNGVSSTSKGGGGGGSSAGTGAAGGTGSSAGGSSGAAGGIAPSGGGGGGNGGSSTTAGQAGSAPGGGGGGGGDSGSSHAGGAGAAGQVTLTYSAAQVGTATLGGVGTLTAQGGPAGIATLSGVGTLTAARSGFGAATLAGAGTLTANATQPAKATLSGVGTLTAVGGLPTPTVVNQWANSYGQGTTFGSITSALQSCVVPLNPANSVGTGSGTPTAGNWLFAIASWTQDPAIINVHTGASDDTHQWWRQFPASGPSDNVRTSVSYVPNIGTGSTSSVVPQYVYVAPDGAVAAVNVLVVEVAGMGPWDTAVGAVTNYAASGTSLSLAQNASGQTLFVAGVGGDNIGSGQAFAPAGWTALATQTQSNGVDTTCDNILTAALISSVSNQSVSASASTPEDMSGFLLAVQVSAASPVPATQNPNWPYTRFEAAFGAGFNTPDSELTWTDLTNRLWSWDETTGIQYQLGQLQSTSAQLELDNFDGALTPQAAPWSFSTTGTPSTHSFFTVTTAQAANITAGDGFTDTKNPGTFFTVTNVGAPAAGNVSISFTPAAATVMSSDTVSQASLVTGVPIRLRMALGTLGGLTFNRWRVIQRNVNEVEEEINSAYRRWIPLTATDLWSSMSSTPPTFYRSEIYQDNPYAWWPMDDQPLEGGVLPVTLLNAALGNTNVLDIESDPGGVIVQGTYGFSGTNITQTVISSGFFTPPEVTPPAGNIATYAVGTNQGWMYGDPASATSSISAAGNPVEASPGSASWQQAGLLGTGGSNGWYLICNDASFPALSGGVTLKGWFNVGLFGSGAGYAYVNGPNSMTNTSLCGQPFSPITICEIATASNPVAVLTLDNSGHLSLTTYNGSTGTSHSIYSASDLRNNTWIAVDITLTTSTWNVMLNGGMTANVSGSGAGMTSAWTYLILGGDFGTSGGTGTSNLVHGGNMSLSHWAVFPYILPAWRILAHYTAAISGFGLLPAPVGTQISPVSGPPVNVATSIPSSPDGSLNAGYQTTPDGLHFDGSYGQSGNSPALYSYSLIATANAGSYSSGPSARAVTSGIGQVIEFSSAGSPVFNTWGYALWLSWTGVSPQFTVYSAAAAAAEKSLETAVADGVSVTSGFGSGASPPAAATPLGDSVGQRIERLMRAGRTTSPQRSIDPAPDLVQAPGNSGGGTQTGTAIQAIQASDQGFLAVDNQGNLFYWTRSHLASQYTNPVWVITPNAPPTPGAAASAIPYYPEIRWVDSDPQRIYNTITVQPFSPDGAQLPLFTPTDATDVEASQTNYGAQALAVTSWLQDQSLQQAQANFLFTNYGVPQTRAEDVRIDAAPYPAAWGLISGISVGDVVTLERWEIGGGGQVFTLRVTEINRKLRYGGMNDGNAGEGEVVASVTLVLDAEPSAYY